MKLFDIFKGATSRKCSPSQSYPHPHESKSPTQIKKYKFPKRVDGHLIQYAYGMNFTPLEGVDVTRDILNGEERLVEVVSNGSIIDLYFNERKFGYIQDQSKAQMVFDWKYKGFPCHAILLSSDNKVNLRFYRDKRIGNETREQTIVALISYKSVRKQEIIEFLENGDELIFEENYDKEDAVDIIAECDKIGSLPKKIAVRYLQDGAFGAFYEHGEENDEGIITPYIRIFW